MLKNLLNATNVNEELKAFTESQRHDIFQGYGVKNFFQIDYPCAKSAGRFANLMPRVAPEILDTKSSERFSPVPRATGSSRDSLN